MPARSLDIPAAEVIGNDATLTLGVSKDFIGMPEGVADVAIYSAYTRRAVHFKCSRPTLERLIEEMQQQLKAVK